MDKTLIISGKSYSIEYVEKALYFFELLENGSIDEQIKEEYKCLI